MEMSSSPVVSDAELLRWIGIGDGNMIRELLSGHILEYSGDIVGDLDIGPRTRCREDGIRGNVWKKAYRNGKSLDPGGYDCTNSCGSELPGVHVIHLACT